jgi:hypothetical protein
MGFRIIPFERILKRSRERRIFIESEWEMSGVISG